MSNSVAILFTACLLVGVAHASSGGSEINFVFRDILRGTGVPHGRPLAPEVHTRAKGCATGYEKTVLDQYCDTLIVGSGPGGMHTALRLAPTLGSSLCIVDNRDRVGGRVQSYRAPASLGADLWSPTCAEQFRQEDTTLRCLSQQFGLTSWVRGTTGSTFDVHFRGSRVPATRSDWFNAFFGGYERYLAPNGIANPLRFDAVKAFCDPATTDFTTCSQEYEMLIALFGNATLAANFARLEDFMDSVVGRNGKLWLFGLYFFDNLLPWYQAKAGVEKAIHEDSHPALKVYVPKGGPQQLYLRFESQIRSQGARFYMSETVQCFDKATDYNATIYPYVARTSAGRSFRAKRIVWGMPPGQFRETVKGDFGNVIGNQEPLRSASHPSPYATINLFFPSRPWGALKGNSADGGWLFSTSNPTGGAFIANATIDPVNGGLVGGNQTLLNQFRQYVTWSLVTDNHLFVQDVPTPERIAANLLRVFVIEERADNSNEVYRRFGKPGLINWAMDALRYYAPEVAWVDPLDVAFEYERYALSSIDAYSTLNIADVRAFAKNPIPGEKMCFTSEGFDLLAHSWQEGSIRLSSECLAPGGIFDGIFTQSQVNSWSSCVSQEPLGRYSYNQTLSPTHFAPPCLHLGNEVEVRDIASNGLYEQACATVPITRASPEQLPRNVRPNGKFL